MKVKVYVSRESAIKAGSETHGWFPVDVALGGLSQRQRDALASLRQHEGDHGISGDALYLSEAVTDQAAVAAALEELADKREAAAAEKAADVEQEVLRPFALGQIDQVRILPDIALSPRAMMWSYLYSQKPKAK